MKKREGLQKQLLLMHLFCEFVKRKIEVDFAADFAKGNSLDCLVENFLLVLHFQGHASELADFAISAVKHLNDVE